MKISKYDILITGSGAAGLFAAYKISCRKDFNGKILIITKSPFGESNSRYAQGGIAAVISDNKADSVKLHTEDTIKSGAGLCDEEVVKFISRNSEKVIDELINISAGFDCDSNGDFEYTLGGAHSVKRVLHSGEDATGRVMINALCNAVKSRKNIDILQKTTAVELILSDKNECIGAVVFNNNTKEHEIIISDNVILATGGCGQVYKYTTNPYGATGDGIALAYNSGLEIQDMEFIQFHPTALALNPGIKNRYLISEAVRGEGAKLINIYGDEFMSQYSEQKELAQRDVVTRAILEEMKKHGSNSVYLDTRKLNREIVLKRFPSIYKKCLAGGIDITKDMIPVAPAAHYMIGGVKTKLNGETAIKGLYVTGELASTGFHGANRLANNSLLECVVCAGKLADEIILEKSITYNTDIINNLIKKFEQTENSSTDYKELTNKLKDIMWNYAGIIRDEKSLAFAINELEKLKKQAEPSSVYSNIQAYEFRNMVITAELITKCAYNRKESRGAHYRSDYPQKQSIAEHSIIKKESI